jgi:hypothetical protein
VKNLTLLLLLLLPASVIADYSPPFNPVSISNCHWYEDDFVWPASAQGKWQALTNTLTGAGAGVAVLSSAGLGNHMGLIKMQTGTTTTGSAQQVTNAAYQPFRFDAASYTFEFVAKIPTLSDGTDTFAVGMGLADMDAGVPIPPQATLGGAYFRYTHGTNSGKWEAVTATLPASLTATDTGIAADTSFHRYTIKVIQSGSVLFYIDGVLVATNSTNVPTTVAANLHWRINKSAGTTTREWHIDAYSLYYCYGTPR